MIFDTTLLIDALSGDQKAINAIESYKGKENAAITILNKYELLRGRKFSEQQTLGKLMDGLNLYGIGNGEIVTSAEIYRALRTKGKLINEFDILIAGITVANNEKLVTNDKDFKEIKKLGYNNFIVIV
ncbi:MAG: type II toxin-antitoxin system VapC family toxin [Candidatus Marsarchaeota archaeon]|nr:type II toxin-antitoxin system VapC family toxin [Candidatus Marsarchaeota archaeon]